jgi:hypothetical protein
VSEHEVIPVCLSPEELGIALEPWLRRQGRYADEMRRDLGREYPLKPASPIPGSVEIPNQITIYVELRSDETAMDLLNSLGRFARTVRRDNPESKPKSGGLRGSAWLLRTPAGELFNAVTVKGDMEGWSKLLESFALFQSRLLGRICASTFIINDGRCLLLDDCVCERSQD